MPNDSKELPGIHKLVVGVDGREGGRDAIALAAALGEILPDLELTLVHAFPYDTQMSRMSNVTYERDLREDALTLLAKARDEVGVDAELAAVADLHPARALHRMAAEQDVDLIVVGSCRRGVLGRIMAGDDVANTLHGAPCAVAVSPRGYGNVHSKVTRIGVALDSSDEARAALTLGAAIAQASHASLRLVTVVEFGSQEVAVYGDAIAWNLIMEERRKEARELLERAGRELPFEVESDTYEGVPAAPELEKASEDLDLLFLGSRGYGPVNRVLLGSTAARLARSAACPLIVLPRGATAPDGNAERAQGEGRGDATSAAATSSVV